MSVHSDIILINTTKQYLQNKLFQIIFRTNELT